MVTVSCFYVTGLGLFVRWSALEDLRIRAYAVTSAVRSASDRLRALVDTLGVGQLQRTDVWAPLDVVRDASAVH